MSTYVPMAGDWVCPTCNFNIFARKTHCSKCNHPRPGMGGAPGLGMGGVGQRQAPEPAFTSSPPPRMFLPAVRANALAPTEELRSLREYVRVLEDKIRVYEERDKKRQREDTAEEANNKKQLSYAQEINIRDP